LFKEDVRGDIEDNAREGTNNGFFKTFDIGASYSGRYHNKCIQDKVFEDNDQQFDVVGAAVLAARDGKMDCRHVVATCTNELTGKPIELRADKMLEVYQASGASFSECPCMASPCEHSEAGANDTEQRLKELEKAVDEAVEDEVLMDSSDDGFCKIDASSSKQEVDNAADNLQASLDRLQANLDEQDEMGSLVDAIKEVEQKLWTLSLAPFRCQSIMKSYRHFNRATVLRWPPIRRRRMARSIA